MASAPCPATPCTPINRSHLRPGDVLLSSGKGFRSSLIKALAGGFYSHAAVWNGEKVVDATEDGIVHNKLQDDISAQWYIDAYRWHSPPPGNQVLGGGDYPYRPVTDEADRIVREETKFAYDELVMAALVVAATRLAPTEVLRKWTRRIMGGLDVWIHKHITGKKKTMMCTGVVCNSFGKAKPRPRYAIKIESDDTLRSLKEVIELRSPSDDEVLQQQVARMLVSAAEADDEFISVTPCDLEQSESLRFVGRLSEEPKPALDPELAKDLVEIERIVEESRRSPGGA